MLREPMEYLKTAGLLMVGGMSSAVVCILLIRAIDTKFRISEKEILPKLFKHELLVHIIACLVFTGAWFAGQVLFLSIVVKLGMYTADFTATVIALAVISVLGLVCGFFEIDF